MSKKPAKKKVVVPAKKKVVVTTSKKESSRSTASAKTRNATPAQRALTFGRDNYLWMGIGLVLVIIGMLLMSGGSMPSPDVWDEGLIYSGRRTVLAPIVILAGLGIEVYAIFKK